MVESIVISIISSAIMFTILNLVMRHKDKYYSEMFDNLTFQNGKTYREFVESFASMKKDMISVNKISCDRCGSHKQAKSNILSNVSRKVLCSRCTGEWDAFILGTSEHCKLHYCQAQLSSVETYQNSDMTEMKYQELVKIYRASRSQLSELIEAWMKTEVGSTVDIIPANRIESGIDRLQDEQETPETPTETDTTTETGNEKTS